jgi:hypothetical protein
VITARSDFERLITVAITPRIAISRRSELLAVVVTIQLEWHPSQHGPNDAKHPHIAPPGQEGRMRP